MKSTHSLISLAPYFSSKAEAHNRAMLRERSGGWILLSKSDASIYDSGKCDNKNRQVVTGSFAEL